MSSPHHSLSTFYSQIFPNYSSARRPVHKDSALARIKEKRLELKALSSNDLDAAGQLLSLRN
jgi:hypothetical protein